MPPLAVPPLAVRLDRRTRQLGDGSVLAGGEPFRLLKLSRRGVAALEALDPVLLARLAEAGLVHLQPPARRPEPGEVTIVIPVLDSAAELERLLASLGELAVVVVDDGSRPTPASTISHLTTHAGARLVRHDGSAGPAAARNAGRAAVGEVRLVGLLDVDTVAEPDWLDGLIGHFDDPRVGAVAPRVRTSRGRAPRWLAAYEETASPLDLGALPGRVGAHRRLSYVPTAALLCRRAALDEVGWFDESLRVGEDVDLLRRLEAAGWAIRYEPAASVLHDCRPDLRSFVAQRFAYGRSGAHLDRLHGGTVAPFEVSPWNLGAWAGGLLALVGALGGRHRRGLAVAGALGGRHRRGLAVAGALGGAVALGLPTRFVAGHMRRLGLSRAAAARSASRLVAAGALSAGTGALTAVRRVWWPIPLAMAFADRRRRRPAMALLVLAQLSRLQGREHAPVALELSLGFLDDAAYGAGAWVGCLQQRSLGSLAPRWAPRGGGGPGARERVAGSGGRGARGGGRGGRGDAGGARGARGGGRGDAGGAGGARSSERGGRTGQAGELFATDLPEGSARDGLDTDDLPRGGEAGQLGGDQLA